MTFVVETIIITVMVYIVFFSRDILTQNRLNNKINSKYIDKKDRDFLGGILPLLR